MPTTQFVTSSDLQRLNAKVFDPLSGDVKALSILNHLCDYEGNLYLRELDKLLKEAITCIKLDTNKNDDTPIEMSLRTKARNQRRFFHLMRNMIAGNTYKSVEHHTDCDIKYTEYGFRVYFFKLFGLSFYHGDKTPVWDEVSKIANFLNVYWNRWLKGEEIDIRHDLDPKADSQTTQYNS